MALLLALLLALSAGATYVQAYPFLWTDPATNGYARANPGCTEHPQRAYGRHLPPTNDTTIAFTVRQASATTGTPTATVCPGRAYSVQVTWQRPRHLLITAPFGATFRSALPATQDFSTFYFSPNPPQCTNRLVTVDLAVSFSDQVNVPCNASGTFALNVTTATGDRGAYLTGSVALTVDRACAAATCPRPASPPPVPKRSPPPKPKSPPPKPKSPPPKPKSPPPRKSPPPSPPRKSPPPSPPRKSPPPSPPRKSPPPSPPRKSPPPSPPRKSPPPSPPRKSPPPSTPRKSPPPKRS